MDTSNALGESLRISRKHEMWLKRAVILMLLFVVSLVILAHYIQYSDFVEGRGEYIGAGESREVYTQVSGLIGELLVEDGTSVKKGTELACVGTDVLYEDSRRLDTVIHAVEKWLEESVGHMPQMETLKIGPIEGSYNKLRASLHQLDNYVQYNDLEGKIETMRAQISISRDIERRLESKKEAMMEEMKLGHRKLVRDSSLFISEVISRQDFENARREVITFSRSIEDVEIALLSSYRRRDEMELAIIMENESHKRELLQLRAEILNSIKGVRYDLSTWNNKHILRSQVNGTIVHYERWQSGDVIEIGQVYATVIPNGRRRARVIVEVSEERFGEVQVGNRVIIRLQAFNYREFGVLIGTVTELTLVPKAGFGRVEVKLTEKQDLWKPEEVPRQDLIGHSLIRIRELSLLQRIFNTVILAIKDQ